MNLLPVMQSDELLKKTTSRCPQCMARCSAEVWRRGGSPSTVVLVRQCEVHGIQETCISSDARFYWLSRGGSEGGCCGSEGACCAADPTVTAPLGRNGALPRETPFEKLSTCLALIEIVNSCNLSCPTCYADSPKGVGGRVDSVPLTEIQSRIQGVVDRKGGIEILQLSGGEPTLHPDFFALVDWVKAHEKIDYLLINTNGVRIAADDLFLAELRKRVSYDNLQVYLQFDGVQVAGQHELRGVDLREVRERAIRRCGEIGLPLTLAMTVTPQNILHLWEAIEYGLTFPHIRGIAFQPIIISGRNPPALRASERPLTTADIILASVDGSAGRLRFEDFTPLPCGDPNCATIGYLLKIGGEVRSVSDFVDFKSVQGFLKDRVRYSLEDLAKCGCESEPLGQMLKQFEIDESHTFRIFIKPFMDARTWDEDRIDRCCTHVIRPDGALDSFCRYYSGFPDIVQPPKL